MQERFIDLDDKPRLGRLAIDGERIQYDINRGDGRVAVDTQRLVHSRNQEDQADIGIFNDVRH